METEHVPDQELPGLCRRRELWEWNEVGRFGKSVDHVEDDMMTLRGGRLVMKSTAMSGLEKIWALWKAASRRGSVYLFLTIILFRRTRHPLPPGR